MKYFNAHKLIITRFIYGCIALLLIFFIFKNFAVIADIEEAQDIANNIKEKEVLDNQEESDTDNDGLLDWQELLYGTDSEIADTDGDGMSDGEEVQKSRSPIIFGSGNQDQIDKILSTNKNVVTLADQKEFFDQAYAERQIREQKIQNILLQKIKTPEELAYLSAESARKDVIFKDINLAGLIIKDNSFDISTTHKPFNNMFLFFFPDNEENAKNIFASGIETLKLPEYDPLSATDKQNIQNFITKYEKIGDGLQKVKINDFDLQRMIKNLGENYSSMSDAIFEIKNLTDAGDREINIQPILMEYSNALILFTKNRKYINDFLVLNKVALTELHPGFFFIFSF